MTARIERRRLHPLLGLAGAFCVSILIGVGGTVARPALPWWRPALYGIVPAALASTALAAPTGDADWLHGLAGCVGLVTLVECALIAAAQWPALSSLAVDLLKALLFGEAAALLLALGLAWVQGRIDVPVALGVCLCVSLAALTEHRVVLGLGLLVGLAAAAATRPATSRAQAMAGRAIWTCASLAALVAMNAPGHAAILGSVILLVEVALTLVWRRRWLVADLLMTASWLAIVALGYPSLLTGCLIGTIALMVLGEARYIERQAVAPEGDLA